LDERDETRQLSVTTTTFVGIDALSVYAITPCETNQDSFNHAVSVMAIIGRGYATTRRSADIPIK
jgi:hypothetical protein